MVVLLVLLPLIQSYNNFLQLDPQNQFISTPLSVQSVLNTIQMCQELKDCNSCLSNFQCFWCSEGDHCTSNFLNCFGSLSECPGEQTDDPEDIIIDLSEINEAAPVLKVVANIANLFASDDQKIIKSFDVDVSEEPVDSEVYAEDEQGNSLTVSVEKSEAQTVV